MLFIFTFLFNLIGVYVSKYEVVLEFWLLVIPFFLLQYDRNDWPKLANI